MLNRIGGSMNTDKAYELLDIIADKNDVDSNDMDVLIKLSQHDDSEIRAYVAELLVLAHGCKAENALINLCNDKDELVRVNACDSLSAFATIDVYKQLVNCIFNDASLLVKEYAILSIVDIMNYIEVDKNELKNLFLNTSSKKEILISAACFKGLYVLGYKEYLNNIIDLATTENYRDRCAVINILGDIIANDNVQFILSVLKALRGTEKSEAVNSTIDRIISEHS